jgi:hypothetical protein
MIKIRGDYDTQLIKMKISKSNFQWQRCVVGLKNA